MSILCSFLHELIQESNSNLPFYRQAFHPPGYVCLYIFAWCKQQQYNPEIEDCYIQRSLPVTAILVCTG